MTFDDTLRHLLGGHSVTNIGQLDRYTVRFLNRAVKSGAVFRDEDWNWPCPKTRYYAEDRAALRASLKRARPPKGES